MFESGARIGGWTLDWRLGGGAGGEVFRAHHDDGRVAALKLARPGRGARLAREAELLAAVAHPGLPVLLDRWPDGYAMALVAGRSLDAVAKAWSEDVALSLLGQAAGALGALHAHGWVHRDLSPTNALVEPGGRLRLLDLGAACPIGGGDLTVPGRVVGDGRVPPEGPAATPARDAWALGSLWRALGAAGPRVDPHLDALTDPDPARRPALADVAAALADAARWPVAFSQTLGAAGEAGPPPTAHLGRYLLLEEIGRGGMGVVFRAWDPLLQRVVAVKTAAGGDAERLVREARAVGALDHPAICRVFDAGVDGGVPWLAMELLPGGTVAGLVTPGGLDVERAVALVHTVAEGLAAAHRAGLVHRDVKPSNLLLDEHDAPRLSDFGLVTSDTPSDLTQRGLVLGTLRYMAPEQARGESATAASDVYALGVVLYELLSGHTPHEDAGAFVALSRRGADPGRPLRAWRRVDADLDGVVARATAFDPADRYADAGAFAEDLGRRLRHEPVRALPPSRVRRARWWVRRHAAALRAVAATVVAVAIVAGAGVGWRALDARLAAARAEADAEDAIRLAERVVEARRSTDPVGAASLFDEIAQSPGLQGTVALAEAWLREAARRDDPAARAHALARAWLAAPPTRQERVLREIADAHAAVAEFTRRADTAALVEALGFAADGPDPLVRDGALAYRQLAHPKVAADPDLGPLLTAWAKGRPAALPEAPVDARPGKIRQQGDITWTIAPTGFTRAQGADTRTLPVPLARLGVDVEWPIEADLDGDGAREVMFHTSFWRGWDLQVVDGQTGAARARARWGSARLGGVVRAGARELVVVQSTRQFGSRIVFPAGSPYGRPTGVALVGLDGARFDVVWSMASERTAYDPFVADLDGDGLEDVVVSTTTGIVVARQRPGARFVGAWIGGIAPRGLVQADDDPALELIADVDGVGWCLGAGDAPLPPRPRPSVSRASEPDDGLRRAMALAAIGLEAEAIAGLEAIRAIEGDKARGARAALLQGTITPGAAADALFAVAAAHPGVAADARAAAAVAAAAEGRVGETLDVDLRAPLDPAWRVDDVTAVRWVAGAGTRITATGRRDLLRLPVEIVGDRARLELDAEVERSEWASEVTLALTDAAGVWLASTILPSRGGRQAVRTGLVCNEVAQNDAVHLAEAPQPRLSGPWWLVVGGGVARCGFGRPQGRPEAATLRPGPGWLTIGAASDAANTTRLLARRLRAWGLRRRDAEPPDGAAIARWHLARLEPAAALAVAPDRSEERLAAEIELGRPVDASLGAVWDGARAPGWLRAAGRVVGDWARARRPAAWPALWWSAYGDAVWQHPDDPEIRAHLVDDLPDALAVAAALDRRDGLVLRTLRGRALRHAGALAAAEAHQDAAMAEIRAALALEADPAERASLHDLLVLATTERAVLALTRGDADGAVAACREGLAVDPIPEYLADGLADHPELAALRDRADLREMLAAVPGWEGPHVPR